MTREQHRYIYVQSGIGAAVVNLLLNGGLGWLATTGLPLFPMYGVPGVFADTLGTAFGVAFGTCFGVVLQVRGDMKRGKITVPQVAAPMQARLDRLPRALLMRALAVGIVAAIVFAPPVLLALGLSGAPALPRMTFIAVKGLFAAVEAAIITPFLVLAALVDTSRPKTPAAASAE